MKTIIIGDSHVATIAKALTLLEGDEKRNIERSLGECSARMVQEGKKFLRPFHKVVAGGVRLTNPEAIAATKDIFTDGLISAEKDRALYLCCGFHGVALNASALWKTHTIDPSRTNERQFISGRAFDAMVKNLNKEILAFFADLKAAAIPFKVLSSPPLPPNYFDVPRPVSEEECRTVDERYKAAFSSCLDQMKIEYILPPDEVYEGRKLRRDLSWGRPGDHHGNRELGKIYLSRLAA